MKALAIRVALVLLIVTAIARVSATHRVFSHTADEPVHILSGYDWWQGQVTTDNEHPPLARLLFGAPSHLRGATTPAYTAWMLRGAPLLWSGGDYLRNLEEARIGNLPFLALLLLIVWLWAKRDLGHRVALLAVALASTTPAILAHAGLATTDVAGAATLLFALYVFTRWLPFPTLPRTLMLGLAMGLGATSKHSFVVFFILGAGVVLALDRRPLKPLAGRALIAAGAMLVVILLLYRFQPLAWIDGIDTVRYHNRRGHPSYLLGQRGTHGWWYYFPVVLFFKTTIPFLLLTLAAPFRRLIVHTCLAMAMLLVVMPSNINIGVRHILIIYPFLAILAAGGAERLWRTQWVGKAAVVALLAWQLIITTRAHPDYLSYFNELAGDEPGRIAGDSNLDWGQDLLRLREVVRRERIEKLGMYMTSMNDDVFDRLGLPPRMKLHPFVPAQGWVAVGESAYQMEKIDGGFAWLKGKPYTRVGESIRLYRLP